ncbi:MAG: histidine kinase dimerization/phospho-acceptor domain-containing protein, partial [Pseudomonadota bacterium]
MQATQEAARAEVTRRSFLSGLNHELRTPLNHIIGFAELLKQADDFVLTEDKRIEYLDLILDAANTLVDQINATLVSSGYGELSPAADPRAKTVVPVLRRLLQEHAQTLFVGKVDIADHLPASALAERDLYRSLQLVFAVLSDERADRQTIGVSVKAHDDGGPVVLIALSVLSGRGKPNTERL